MIAGGGDGTINVIINAIAGTDAALGILPLGTANDFARQMGIPRTAVDAAQRIVSGRTKRCDVVSINGRRFCTVGGLGLVTECALIANRLKSIGHPLRPFARRMRSAIYPVVAVTKIVFGKHGAREIDLAWTEVDVEKPSTARVTVHGILFANQRMLGGGLALPIEACNDDGMIEICAMNTTSRLGLLWTVLALKMAWPIRRNVMILPRAIRARIESGQELGFLGDGELLCAGKHFELEVVAGGLSVVC